MSIRPFTNNPDKRDELRLKLFVQQNGLCHLCGEPMTLERKDRLRAPKNFASFDHLTPKSEGGTSYYTNLKLAHRSCNSARQSRPLGTYVANLQSQG